MVKFPDDFWKALKSGDTSDWLFWVDIAIIVGALFVLLCFVRCCMWCFNSKKDDEKYDPNVQDAKVPPAWLHHEHPSQPAGIPPHYQAPQGGNMAVHQPQNPHQIPSSWNQPNHAQYNHNPAYSQYAGASSPQYQRQQGAPMHQQPMHQQQMHQQPPYQGYHGAHPSQQQQQNSPNWNGQYAVHPVPAPAPPRKDRQQLQQQQQQQQQSAIGWSKEDFESVFSEQASIDMLPNSSSPGADRPDGKSLLKNTSSTSSKPIPSPQQQGRGNGNGFAHPAHAQASPYMSDSPSRRESPSRRDSPSHAPHMHGVRPPHTPPSPYSPTTNKPSIPHDRASAGSRNSSQRGSSFHANNEDIYRAQGNMRTPPAHKQSPSMHSTPGTHTPPGTIPSKKYNSSTTSPSDLTPSDSDAGTHGRGAMHGRNGSFTRGGVPKLQPPLPVSPRIASLLDNAMYTNNTSCSEAPPLLPDVGTGMGHGSPENTASPQPQGKAGDARIGQTAGSTPPMLRNQEHPGRALRMQQEALGNNFSKFSRVTTGESRGGETGRAVNPSAYAAMYENELRSKNLNTGGLSASQSQGFHLEAELMLVGGGAGDSDGSILEGRDLAQVALDTQTVAVVECPEDATLTEFLGLTRQRHVHSQFVDKNTDHSDRALAVWDLGVRLWKLRRRDEAQFAVMRRLHRLPNSPESRFWKQAIDIDFEADSFHPALGHRMTVSGAEEVIFVEIANQSGMWLELRLPPQPPPGVMHERWVKLVMQEGSVVSLPKGCTYMLGMPENGMVGLLRARMAAASS